MFPTATVAAAFTLAKQFIATSSGPVEIEVQPNYDGSGNPVFTQYTSAGLSYTTSLLDSSPITIRSIRYPNGSPVLLAGRSLIGIQGTTNGTRRSGAFIAVTQECAFYLENLKITSFASALTSTQDGRLYGTIIDIRNCPVGISAANKGFISFIKGDWDGRDLEGNPFLDVHGVPNSIGFRSLLNSTHNLQQSAVGDLDIHHWDRCGLVADGGNTGHTDKTLFRFGRIGLELSRGAGALNLTGTQYEDMTLCGILDRGTRGMILSENTVFLRCADNVIATDHWSAATMESTGYDIRPGYFRSAGVTTQTNGSGAEVSLWAPIFITMGRMRDRDTLGKINIDLSFVSLSSNATIKLRMGATVAGPTGTVLTSFVIPSGADSANISGTLKAVGKDQVTGNLTYEWFASGTSLGRKNAKFAATGSIMNASDYTGVTFTITLANGNKVTVDPTTDVFTTLSAFDGYISPPIDDDDGGE